MIGVVNKESEEEERELEFIVSGANELSDDSDEECWLDYHQCVSIVIKTFNITEFNLL